MDVPATRTISPATLATQFELHTRLFNNVLEGIDDSSANGRASDEVNHIKWLAGHLTNARHMMKDFGGIEEDDPHGELFGHGKSISEAVEYPSLDEIRDRWNSISHRIGAGLSNLPDDVLNGPAPGRFPVADDTMAGMLAFLMHHEAYHIGQIGILRKYIGKEAMEYK